MGCSASKPEASKLFSSSPPNERISEKQLVSTTQVSAGMMASMVKKRYQKMVKKRQSQFGRKPMVAADRKGSVASATGFLSEIPAEKAMMPLGAKFVRKKSNWGSAKGLNAGSQTMKELEEKYILDVGILLGKGGFASVVVVKGRATGDSFAMKVQQLQDADDLEEIRAEIATQSSLDHPNIAKIFEFYEDEVNRELSIIMEYMSGGSLQEHLNKKYIFEVEEVASILKKLLNAIGYCHRHGVVHRDIKPANIVYESDAPDAEVKLIDFGLAAQLRGSDIMIGQMGTAKYMAPELWDEILVYDSSVDMWAIGVTAYVLFCNKVPFRGKSQQELMQNIAVAQPEYDFGPWLDGSLPADCKAFCKDMLRKDPAERPPATKAVEHVFFRNNILKRTSETASETLKRKTEVVDSLHAFAHADPLQKLALEIIAFSTAPAKVEELRKLFQKIDIDDSGTLSMDEFRSAMSLHPELSEERIEEMFIEMDVTNSGEIGYSEFLSATLAAQAHTVDEIKNAFELLDSDQDGYITLVDLVNALDGQIDEAMISTALNCHADNDGNLGLMEFIEVVQAGLTLGTQTRNSILDGRRSLTAALDERASIARASERMTQSLKEDSLAEPSALMEKSVAKQISEQIVLKERRFSKVTMAQSVVMRAEVNALTNELKSVELRQNVGEKLLELSAMPLEESHRSKSSKAKLRVSFSDGTFPAMEPAVEEAEEPMAA